MKNFLNKRVAVTILFVLSLALYFLFGIFHIGKFVTADERFWLYDRVPQYWKAISSKNWKKTYVHEKPGIALSIISGAGLLEYKNPTASLKKINPNITGDTFAMEKFLTAFRLPILIFNGLFALFLFWIIKKLTLNAWKALWSVLFIYLSPVLIGISQIVNADALLWTFSSATLLSYAAWLKLEKKKFAILASLFLGLAMLTKFTSVILMPFLFVMIFLYLMEIVKEHEQEKITFSRNLVRVALSYVLIIAGSLLVFAILMPASFVKFKYLYDGTIGYSEMPLVMGLIFGFLMLIIAEYFLIKNKITIKILLFVHKFWVKYSRLIYLFIALAFVIVFLNYFLGRDFLNLEKVPFDTLKDKLFYEKSWIIKMLLEFRPVIFSLTPLVLFATLFVWIKYFFRTSKDSFLVMSLTIFILVFEAGVIQQKLLNNVRYSIILYPLFAILAALGLHEFFSSYGTKIKKYWITLIILAFSFLSLWMIKPFYFNYTNFLLPKKYVITDSWGYGGYEAAQYLNKLPNAKNMAVWSDYSGFCEFFIGQCTKSKCNLPEGAENFNYFVITRRGEILHIPEAVDYVDLKNRGGYRDCSKKHSDVFEIVKKQYADGRITFTLPIDGREKNSITITESE